MDEVIRLGISWHAIGVADPYIVEIQTYGLFLSADHRRHEALFVEVPRPLPDGTHVELEVRGQAEKSAVKPEALWDQAVESAVVSHARRGLGVEKSIFGLEKQIYAAHSLDQHEVMIDENLVRRRPHTRGIQLPRNALWFGSPFDAPLENNSDAKVFELLFLPTVNAHDIVKQIAIERDEAVDRPP